MLTLFLTALGITFTTVVGLVILRFIRRQKFFGNPAFKDPQSLNTDCFDTIFHCQESDRHSKYTIDRVSNNEMKFQKNGYTLFTLKKSLDNNAVKLSGLDGYGIRDKEFAYFVCELAHTISNEKSRN